MVEEYIGCEYPLEKLRAVCELLAKEVVARVNDTQELVLVNDFAKESNEGQFKRCLEDRIADISSWRWVLTDLTKRLNEIMTALCHERKAVRVVLKRLDDQIEDHSIRASKPGALSPQNDRVELSINKELKYLKNQKKHFIRLGKIIEKQIANLEKVTRRIDDDILNKNDAINVEEEIRNVNLNSIKKQLCSKNQTRKYLNLSEWENRCLALKQEGLQALKQSLLTKQQLRGARVQLTIASKSLSNEVDAALRRRLHTNQTKLAECLWQRRETEKDLEALYEEQVTTENSILANMDQMKVVEARVADRRLRPEGELTRDEVHEKLREELHRLNVFMKDLNRNLDEIADLQKYLRNTVATIDCASDDLRQVITLDSQRLAARLGECDGQSFQPAKNTATTASGDSGCNTECDMHLLFESNSPHENLPSIKEETEEEDDIPYPFDY